MKNPCVSCHEGGLCGAKFPCHKRDAYNRLKQKAAEINHKTKEMVERAQRVVEEKEYDL